VIEQLSQLRKQQADIWRSAYFKADFKKLLVMAFGLGKFKLVHMQIKFYVGKTC